MTSLFTKGLLNVHLKNYIPQLIYFRFSKGTNMSENRKWQCENELILLVLLSEERKRTADKLYLKSTDPKDRWVLIPYSQLNTYWDKSACGDPKFIPLHTKQGCLQ